MPRTTTHKSCTQCGARARVCVFSAYYEVGACRSGRMKAGPMKGSLPPTKGFCATCFLRFVSKRNVSREYLQQLRRRLSVE
jgi:hypothetical protein